MRRLILALIAAAAPAATACGFHDDVMLQRGLLNWVYPEALHVRTAVWGAQLTGRIERDEYPYLMANLLLAKLRPHLPTNASLVLITPMLWTRYDPEGVRVHAEGPAPGDPVVVTEVAVVKAILEERLTMVDAQAGGLLRIYPPH